jgi:restriction endonuclease S subunit
MTKTLGEIANIKFGFYAKPIDGKGIPYIQARHFNVNGNMIVAPDTFIKSEYKVTEQMLRDGDVLFAGKGYKNFAWCYRKSFGDAVASTLFFVLTPNTQVVLPEYLTALLNYPKNQLYFQQLASGSSIPSIRKNELTDFKVPIVPLDMQARIVEIYKLHRKDISLTLELLERKSDLYESVFNALVNNN